MSYKISPNDIALRLNETDRIRSVLQNVSIILSTWKGTVPMYREFGISSEYMHKPLPVAEVILRAQIREAIEKYEPRAMVESIGFTQQGDGQLIPTVEVTILE